jgi:hypothetical protein
LEKARNSKLDGFRGNGSRGRDGEQEHGNLVAATAQRLDESHAGDGIPPIVGYDAGRILRGDVQEITHDRKRIDDMASILEHQPQRFAYAVVIFYDRNPARFHSGSLHGSVAKSASEG